MRKFRQFCYKPTTVGTIIIMLLFSLLGWWYGSGWTWLLKEISRKLYVVKETFSVPILLRTLFSPWKQIQTQSTFQNFFQAAIDNLVSRFIGAILRIGMLIAAIFSTTIILALGMISFIAWPLLPALIIILPLMSVAGVELW